MSRKEPKLAKVLREEGHRAYWLAGGRWLPVRAHHLLDLLAFRGTKTIAEVASEINRSRSAVYSAMDRIDTIYLQREVKESGELYVASQATYAGRIEPGVRTTFEPKGNQRLMRLLRNTERRLDYLWFLAKFPTETDRLVRDQKQQIIHALCMLCSEQDPDCKLEDSDWSLVGRSQWSEPDPGIAAAFHHLRMWAPNADHHEYIEAQLRFCQTQLNRFGEYERPDDTPLNTPPVIVPPLPFDRALLLSQAADQLRQDSMCEQPHVHSNGAYLLRNCFTTLMVVDRDH